MMISVILFSLMQLFISMTSPAANIFQQVFFRNFLGMGICIYYIRKEKQTEKIPYFGDLKSQPYLLGRSLFGFLGLLLMFYATRHALLADVTILTRTGPLFTTLVAVFFCMKNCRVYKSLFWSLFLQVVGWQQTLPLILPSCHWAVRCFPLSAMESAIPCSAFPVKKNMQ